jgi:hypothetical protein
MATSYHPDPSAIVTDLQGIIDGMKAGTIILDQWTHSVDITMLGYVDDFTLRDLRPYGKSQVANNGQREDRLIALLQAAIVDYQGQAPGCTVDGMQVTLVDLRTYMAAPDMMGYNTTQVGVSLPPAEYTISLEFRLVAPVITALTTAAANVSSTMKAFSTLMGNYTVADIPFPVGKPLKDLGVSIEPIVGYRDFYPDLTDDGSVLLYSRNDVAWTPRKKLRAFCVSPQSSNVNFFRHDAPDVKCKCGIYAFDSPDHDDMKISAYVWGEVYLWGEVLICQSGYRAEYAYPKTLFVLSNGTKTIRWMAEELEREYGVPVFLVNKKDGQSLSSVIDTALQHLTKGGENS